MARSLKIGISQFSCSQNEQENVAKAKRHFTKLADSGAQIVCFQELFSSIYFCFVEDQKWFELARKHEDELIMEFRALCAEHKTALILPYFEKRTEGLYHNSALVINAKGEIEGNYRKQHIPDDPGYYEKYYFTPGDEGYKVFDLGFTKIAVLICWDQWFPEAARLSALKGAEILFYPTAIGWDMEEKDEHINTEQKNAWRTIQQAHAIANGCFVVNANRVGSENCQQFWGGSFVSNPFGTLLWEADSSNDIAHVVALDLDSIANYRNTWPYLRDRRIDTYSDITKRFID
jgi:N-carbamoylputrescine amidase